MKIRPIILSGGSGTRLWPVSRKRQPKQFAELLGRYSLLASVLEMVEDCGLFLPPLVVANEEHKFLLLDIVKNGGSSASILLEPCARNTAAAALAASLSEHEPDVLHLLMPSDHVIADPKLFFAAVGSAEPAARAGGLALFGIEPKSPETGYGYIRRGAATPWRGVSTVESFTEKPNAETAAGLIGDGALWNSGIFLYDPQVLVGEIERLSPQHLQLCHGAVEKASIDFGCGILDKNSYEKLPDISLDHLVVEKTKLGVVVPCAIGWSDIRSWDALWQWGVKDKDGNVTQGAVAALETGNSYIRSDGPLVGVIGLQDVAVVATKDAVLVMPRARSQDVKQLVEKLDREQHKAASESNKTLRPWGFYEGVAEGRHFKVKHIVVKPGQSLSLQMHRHRAEHWVVVQGAARVERDGVTQMMAENQSLYISKGARHRLSNPGKVDLHLVEVQTGAYLGEDDIVRFSDNYGRIDEDENIVFYQAARLRRRPV